MHVAVCCITFRRPQGLRRLLEGLNRLAFAKTPQPRITVVVVDNDRGAPMRAVVESLRRTFRWSLTYDCEPAQGLSNARNRSLARAPPSADYVAFIDDDEVPVPTWLDELLHVARTHQAPIVQGPVVPVFPRQAPAWVRRAHFFEQGPYRDGADLHFASTNNCLVERAVIRRLGGFDQRFNLTGGEDQHFFSRAITAGHRVITAEKAVVHESVPATRATLGYLLRRRFRMGNTLSMVDRIDGGHGLLMKRAIKSGGRFGLGLAQGVVLSPKGLAGLATGLCNAAQGLGGLAGLVGVLYHEYGARETPDGDASPSNPSTSCGASDVVRPTFLGLGAQKCATSWIHKVLEDHPQVFVSEPKELDFFTHHFNRGYTWYEHHFEGEGTAKAIGEISPSYWCDPLAPERVHRYRDDIRLIVALRDPIARAFSNHLHEIRKGFYHGENLLFESGLKSNPMYVFQSRYGTHLARWLEVFPRDRILILVQEEIETDPTTACRRLYSFIGVDPEHRSEFLFRRSHESVGARHPGLFRVWRLIGDYARRRGLDRWVETLKALPPVAAAMAANRRDLKAEVPRMRPETEQALQREFAPELVALADLVGHHDWPWPTWRAAQAMMAERTPAGHTCTRPRSAPQREASPDAKTDLDLIVKGQVD